MPNVYKSMLAYFQLVHNLPGYEERPLIVEPDEDYSKTTVSWEAGRDSESVGTMPQNLIEVSKVEQQVPMREGRD